MRTIGFLITIGIPRSLGLDPILNLFAGGKWKIDEAHPGAFFSFSNPVDLAGSFDGFERAWKLKSEEQGLVANHSLGGRHRHAAFADVENNAAVAVTDFDVFGGPDGVTKILSAFGGQRTFRRHLR